MNYAALRKAIIDYTVNSEPVFLENIPLFVRQAELRIYNTVLFPSLRRNVTGAISANVGYLACPDDFNAVFALAAIDQTTGRYTYLVNKEASFIRQAYPNPAATGAPRFYAIYGPRSDNLKELTLLLGPTPDKAYSAELHYFFYPTSIVEASETWLGDTFDSVLLYGALVEAYTFMKGEPDMVKLYDDKFKEALLLAKHLGDGLLRSDIFRSGEPRVSTTAAPTA